MTEQHESLAAALAAFQAEIPTIRKGNTATVKSDKGNYSYDYADLADVTEVVLPLLGAHGLAWITVPTFDDVRGFGLHYELRHETGESISGVYPLPAPSAAAQSIGAAITYARRYTLCAVTGVAPGGDDQDGPPSPVRPSTDWLAKIRAASTVGELQALYVDIRDSGEGTEALRNQWAARMGVVQRQEQKVNHDGDAAERPAGDAVPAADAARGGAEDRGGEQPAGSAG